MNICFCQGVNQKNKNNERALKYNTLSWVEKGEKIIWMMNEE